MRCEINFTLAQNYLNKFFPKKNTMQKFEYKTIKMKPKTSGFSQKLEDEKLVEEMNILGQDGWELVTLMDNKTGGTTQAIVLIFKRPLG